MNGHDKLWGWFGMSYASWLTLPRVMMHEMPDEWQAKMAELLKEFDATWGWEDMPDAYVSARKDNRFTEWPSEVLNYRYPDQEFLAKHRKEQTTNTES